MLMLKVMEKAEVVSRTVCQAVVEDCAVDVAKPMVMQEQGVGGNIGGRGGSPGPHHSSDTSLLD